MFQVPGSDRTTHFVPGPERTREFRDALGGFATGVTVVTTATPQGPVGMTANSFASVSLDPPVVLWSVARQSSRFAAFAECERFAVHVLGADQLELSRRFARNGASAFDGLELESGVGGVPLLAGCLSRFECARLAAHDGGDHLIVVARVTAATFREGEPLVFSRGGYGRFDRFSEGPQR